LIDAGEPAEALRTVRVVLTRLAPPGLAVGTRLLDPADEAGLHPAERAAITGAVAARRTAFATGRALLRSLVGPGPIPRARSGAPVPPPRWAVSLAHDRSLAVAVAGRRPGFTALGVDVEPDTDLDDDEAAIIRRADDEPIDPLAALVIKEAAYKAWSSVGGPLLDFHDLRLTVDDDRFEAVPVAGGRPISGRYGRGADRWVALAIGDGSRSSVPSRPFDGG